jgi:hypothetical protein
MQVSPLAQAIAFDTRLRRFCTRQDRNESTSNSSRRSRSEEEAAELLVPWTAVAAVLQTAVGGALGPANGRALAAALLGWVQAGCAFAALPATREAPSVDGSRGSTVAAAAADTNEGAAAVVAASLLASVVSSSHLSFPRLVVAAPGAPIAATRALPPGTFLLPYPAAGPALARLPHSSALGGVGVVVVRGSLEPFLRGGGGGGGGGGSGAGSSTATVEVASDTDGRRASGGNGGGNGSALRGVRLAALVAALAARNVALLVCTEVCHFLYLIFSKAL